MFTHTHQPNNIVSQSTVPNGDLSSATTAKPSPSSSSTGITVAFDNSQQANRWMKSSAATVLIQRCKASFMWGEGLARCVIAEYAKFCCLKARMGDTDTQSMVPPSLIQMMWQAHYLDSMSYIADIKAICGSDQIYLHYNYYELNDPSSLSQRIASTKTAVRALFAGNIDAAVWRYHVDTDTDSTKETASVASRTARTARAHADASTSRPSTTSSARPRSVQAAATSNPAMTTVDEITFVSSSDSSLTKADDNVNEEEDASDDEEGTIGTIEETETDKGDSCEESSPEPVVKRTRRPSSTPKSGTRATRTHKTNPNPKSNKRRAASTTEKRGGGSTTKRRKSTDSTSTRKKKKTSAPEVGPAPTANPIVGIPVADVKTYSGLNPIIDIPPAPPTVDVSVPPPQMQTQMTVTIKNKEKKERAFIIPVMPSTTVGSLKVSYAKDAYPRMELWEIASNLVIMHASVSLPDDTTVSSIPFRGDFDCLEAVLDLEPCIDADELLQWCRDN